MNLLAVAALALSVTSMSAAEVAQTGARVYVNNMGGFGSYLAAALRVKGVPVTVVMDRRQADFEIVGTSESKNPNWAEVIFLKHGRSTESATITLVNLRSTEAVFAYAYNMGQAYFGKQSAAESCAKHLREAIVKGRVNLSRTAGATLSADDADRPAGETTTVPPSETGAAGALPAEQLLMSVMVNSQPSDATVEVDGTWAGRTPVSVKVKAGTYQFRVFTSGFQPWTQKVTVEVGKAQTLGIALSESKK